MRTPETYEQILIPVDDIDDSLDETGDDSDLELEVSAGEAEAEENGIGDVQQDSFQASTSLACDSKEANGSQPIGDQQTLVVASHGKDTQCQATGEQRPSQPNSEVWSAPMPLRPDDLEELLHSRLKEEFGSDEESDEEDEGQDFWSSNNGFSADVGRGIYVPEEEEEGSLVVDVVAEKGKVWVKVVARNPLSLHRSCQGKARLNPVFASALPLQTPC